MDNAKNNDTMMRFIADALLKDGVYYDPRHRRLRCNGHVINLAVQEFRFGEKVDDYEYPEEMTRSPSSQQIEQWRKLGPLGKLHNINIYIMKSPQRVQKFRGISGGLMPRRDNGTRWNSWFSMLDWSVTRIKTAI